MPDERYVIDVLVCNMLSIDSNIKKASDMTGLHTNRFSWLPDWASKLFVFIHLVARTKFVLAQVSKLPVNCVSLENISC